MNERRPTKMLNPNAQDQTRSPRRFTSVVAYWLFVFLSVGPALRADEITRADLVSLVTPLVEGGFVDGVSVGIIRGDERWTIHLGSTDGDQTLPDDQTIYEIGSISKVFTGLLLADAVVRGGVTLDADADVEGVTPLPRLGSRGIQWIDLATHRSGLPRLASNMADRATDNPYANYGSAAASEFLQSYELIHRPGAKVQYSNFGVSWLGHLLAERQQTSYEDLLRSAVTEPLGMVDTAVALTPSQVNRFAVGHGFVGTPTPAWTFADLPGAGGIRSTTQDMLRFMAAVLDPPDNACGKAIELAWQLHRPAEPPSFAMGLGWMIARDGQTRWHNGQTGGFHSAIFVNRGLRVGVVVLANTGPAPQVDQVAESLVQRLAGMSVEPLKLQPSIQVDANSMERLVGRYQLAANFVFDVHVVDGRLMVAITNQPTLEVFPKSATRWFYKVVDAELDFELGETGPATAVVLHQNGVRQSAKRID